MSRTRKPDPRVKAPEPVQIQEGFSPSKKSELEERVKRLRDFDLSRKLVEEGEIVLPLRDLMKIMVGVISPWIQEVERMKIAVDELTETVIHFADEARKAKKKR